MSKIFISYRRSDSAPYAGRIYDHLSAHFGRDQIFMDIDTIKPGVDFVEVLENAVQQCDALIAVIGRQWVTVTDAAGNRRLDDPHDFTRLEVEAALDRNIRVFPVLVDGVDMPRTSDLPDSLARLTRRNALTISNERFSYDINKLISALDDVINPPAPPMPASAVPIPAPLAETKAVLEKKATQHIATTVDQSGRKRGIWLTLYFIVPVLGGLLALVDGLLSPQHDAFIIGTLVFDIVYLLIIFVAIISVLSWKKWGVYLLTGSIFSICWIGWFYFHKSSRPNVFAESVEGFIFSLGLLWLVLRNKWKYFD